MAATEFKKIIKKKFIPFYNFNYSANYTFGSSIKLIFINGLQKERGFAILILCIFWNLKS